MIEVKYVFMMLLLSGIAFGAPALFDGIPVDNSYYGRSAINFSVNITGAGLQSGNVYVFAISQDAYNNNEPWDNYTLSCANYAGDSWICTRTISFAIAGTDTLEYFYFQATDAGGTGTLGSAGTPLSFRIDRTGPAVAFVSPANNSFVSGNVEVSVAVSDTISGINPSTLSMSINGGAWTAMVGNKSYVDTTAYADNTLLQVRVNVTDNVGNPSSPALSVSTDNTPPSIAVAYPQQGSVLSGTKTLNITVTDALSGVDKSRVYYSIGGASAMTCANSSSECAATINTLSYADGNYTINFTAYDNASKSQVVSVPVLIKNNLPALTLSPEGYARGVVNVTAAITNPEGVISSVTLQISGPSPLNVTMACSGDFTSCVYVMDTAQFAGGLYALSANATNSGGYNIYDTASLIVDNTNPNLTATAPAVTKSVARIEATVVDANPNLVGVSMIFLGSPSTLTCIPQDTTLFCYIDYNFSSVSDGRYNITVSAADYAGNSVASAKEITVDKDAPSISYVKIQPLNPDQGAAVLIEANVTDKGTGVKFVTAVVRYGPGVSSLSLAGNGTVWSQFYYAVTSGAYEVDMLTEDNNGNSANVTRAGYFFLGQLSCGDGVCQSVENYCLCPTDCSAPQCPLREAVVCSSGIPVCGALSACGDKVCSASETCGTCSKDCGVCPSGEPPKPSSNESVTEELADFATAKFPTFITAIVTVVLLVMIILIAIKSRSKA